jgi:hypothetical protein
MIAWKTLEGLDSVNSAWLKAAINKLGGDGITLLQARKACKDGVFNLLEVVELYTTINYPNRELALGKMVAHIHPKISTYYKKEEIYHHNQKCLLSGRLEDIDGSAAVKASKAATKDDATYTWTGWAVNWASYRDAGATMAAGITIWSVTCVEDLIDIYFNGLEEA